MDKTFLTHVLNNCGGAVVLEILNTHAKIISPSFAVGRDGISNMSFDIKVINSSVISPVFSCSICNEVIPMERIGVDVSCVCQICGKQKPVSEINVHSEIATICNLCIKEIKKFCSSKDTPDTYIRNYVVTYGLTEKLRVIPLSKILSNPVGI